jgi:probable F420-dependent oxidoreductase
MKFGFQTMLRGAASTPEGLTAIAEKGEACGFDIIAPNDHIIVPGGIESTYPYTDDGIWPGAAVVECHEQLTALTFIAGKTERIRILPSVMVVPYRAPVLTAKIIATADVLSEGRITLGVGAGWMAEEIDAIGAPPFSERGIVTDEYIKIFKELWTSDNPKYEGNYARFSDLHFKPLPIQKPHPPIWVGGESKPALRRVARLGNGWYPASNNPRFRVATPAQLAGRMDVLRQVCDEEGRDSAELDIGYFFTDGVHATERRDDAGARKLMTGAPADIAGDIAAFGKAGVGTMIFIFQRPEVAATLDQMEWFSSEVMPLLK